ncbi:MAG: N-acetylmuramoyl-L-alanine amidase [Alkalibacterium gilvum]|uniref:N-acetylmuramoyl-L-alanine amidase n=1 Tax=Alkalibacterium gilvum TaxID=1130080 RepID=A0A1H6R7W5_9LACT|nr:MULTISPECIES: N-acetylmuramoyl-L-alanine amidase [Alkalibacterium]MDN6293483.1 N-acetylmuramoyl-L-alanine amidase [Alkalibacterium sp.]MDN6295159.1 N-acetylmuramoyl-L-alanine amidase [Alkalibacterium sp.]MDN6398762.1 N-acetylmuramoyl-L-alanine amidase [Alkalibacterium sp.]MDN6728608.1 N-acetylmuramoyl-L-alanine amidase [Alkalibacterium sp.]SEI49324.1 N-acetylmuramoyl-L-alanine amidase [Alkalibacterium gilvum]
MKLNYLHNKNYRSIFILLVSLLFILLFSSIVALANGNKVTVSTSTLNVRYGPGLSHEILTQVHEDDQLRVLEEENEWYKVKLESNQIGWVASWLVKNEEVSLDNKIYGRISTPNVNVRQFSTTDSEIIGELKQGEEVPILYRDGNWVQILFDHRVAWVHANLITVIDASEKKAGTNSTQPSRKVNVGYTPTNIRKAPSTNSEIITTLSSTQEVVVISEDNDWYEIKLNDGSSGFVASWLTKEVSADTTNAKEVLEDTSTTHYATTLAEATIVIDPGHGGYDPGAVASSGFLEKDITLNTAQLLSDQLEKSGANVIMTRNTDEFISLNDRVYYAHRANADAFISLHYDAVQVANTVSGTTTYYYSESEKNLAEVINNQLTASVPLSNNGVRHGNYQVLRQNTRPSVLLELGYLNNDHDINVVNTHAYQSSVASAVYSALDLYFSQQ